jgi:hypothetical protein
MGRMRHGTLLAGFCFGALIGVLPALEQTGRSAKAPARSWLERNRRRPWLPRAFVSNCV